MLSVSSSFIDYLEIGHQAFNIALCTRNLGRNYNSAKLKADKSFVVTQYFGFLGLTHKYIIIVCLVL